MKKILTLMLVLCGILVLAACTGLPGSNPGDEHTHEVSQAWAFDTENHWHTCSGCDELLDKAAHSLGEWEVVTEATETAAGEKKRECECGYSETEAIAKLEHVHKYEWTTKTPATCTEAEVELGTCACGDTTTREGDAALGHSWDQGVVTTEPTEEAEGVKTYTCSACGETKTESIPKLGHTHVFAEELKYNDTKHWKECSCGEKSEEADHVYGEWTRVEGEYKEVQSCECGASNTRDITVYEVEVNDELVEVEELAKGSDNYVCKVLVAKGDLVTIYVSGTALKVKDSTETIYVAESYGYYTFYVNTKNQVWPSFTEGVQFSAYKLYVNNVETDCAVTVEGTDYAQFEVELKVDDVVTIFGDEKELTAEGGYKVTVEGKHTFYVNNKNEVYPVAPSAPVDPDAPEPTGLTLYLKPNANWKADNARFAVYCWNASGNSWENMTDSDGDGIYEVTVDPASCTSVVIFCRMNPNNSTNNWNNKWNQTADLKSIVFFLCKVLYFL